MHARGNAKFDPPVLLATVWIIAAVRSDIRRDGPSFTEAFGWDLRVLTTTVSHHNVIDVEAMENLARRLQDLTRAECDRLAATIMVALEAMDTPQIRGLPKLDSTIKGGQPQLKKYRKAPKVRK